ncbi:MAG TPA: Mur ligase domain-containing protein, partial [Fimbriimonadaceae bacterium]|nr:Mur ligase domain-containing protein [Fimbriimonadaceae bacterium]
MKRLSQWLAEAGVEIDAVSGDAGVSGISADSRTVRPGDLFVCMPSSSRDTHEFIGEVVSKGASAVLVHSPLGLDSAKAAGVPGVLPTDFGDGLWRLAKALSGNPSGSMRVVGVTGTNGKTTTAWLIR